MSRPFDHRTEAIFQEALAAAPERRTSLIRERCGEDPALVAEVESLLSHHEADSDVLDRAVVKSPTGVRRSSFNGHEALPPLHQAGGYRLISVLGTGGMGVVYLAEQEKPRRTVALKLIRALLATPSAKRRFEHEAELLARLQHPGIAQIYEAGVADFGHGAQQFIAMELVRGEPLNHFARTRDVDVPTRLRLMIKICEAVHHAHQRGVIHRDLKPLNILLVPSGANGSSYDTARSASGGASNTGEIPQPKILDFGVARVLDSDIAVTTMQTSAGQLVGTLRYMSPEQIAGDHAAIDARSDVYALGIILYELLARRLPYVLDNCSIAEAARIIRDQPHTSLSSFSRSFRGDIETIVSKALEKDPRRRYQSAAELGLDLQRHLSNQPIIARPASALYSARKFVRRNKAVVSGVAIAFLALILGMAFTTRAMLEARQQREVAQQQVRVAQAINNFLNEDLLALADPMQQPNANLTLREALDRSAAVVDERFRDEPEVAAAIHTTIGLAYQNLALHEKAQEHLQAALDLRRSQYPPDRQDIAAAVNLLAVLHFHRGNFEEAEAGYKQAMAILEEVSGPNSTDFAGNLIGLALIEQARGNLPRAETLIRQSLQSKIDALGEYHPDTADAKDALAAVLGDLGKHDEAERLFREALAVRQAQLGPDNYLTLLTVNNLAVLLISRDKLDEAKSLLHRVLQAWEHALGPEHPAIATLHHNLSDIARRQGDVDSAERELRAALESFRKSYGDDHENTMTATTVLAELLLQTRRPEEAEPYVRDALDRRMRINGPDHPGTLVAIMDLGWLYRMRGDIGQAIAHYKQGLAGRRRVLGDDHPATLRAMGQVAALHTIAADHQKAETLYRELASRRERLNGSDDPSTVTTVSNLARSLAAQDRFADAQPLFQTVVDRRQRTLETHDPDLAAALHDLGENSLKSQQFELAESSLRRALEIRRQLQPPAIAPVRQSQLALASTFVKLERHAEAEPLLLEIQREMQADQPPDQGISQQVLEQLVAMYESWQKPVEAEQCRGMLQAIQSQVPASQPTEPASSASSRRQPTS